MIYFAYGSNLHLEQMLRRCPDAEPLTQAVLHGYRLTYRRGFATVEKADKKDRVYGALYRISKRDLKALDAYESYPIVYYRDTIQVEAREVGMIHAMTYKMHKCFEVEPPRADYYEIIQEGYRNWGLPMDSLKMSLENLGSVGISAGRQGYYPSENIQVL